jgi:replicative DNA helicase
MKTYDEELEKGILNQMIYHDDHCAAGLIQLKREDFFNTECKSIFDIIVKLTGKNIKVDYPEVAGRMRDADIPTAFLTSVYDNFITSTDFKGGLVQLRNMSYLRGIEMVTKQFNDLVNNESDMESIINKAESLVLESIGRKEITNYKLLSKTIEPMLTNIEDRIKGNTGLKTGIKSLDKTIIGLPGGCLVVVAARPSMGKSALSASILLNIAETGRPGGLFSLEMRAESIAERYISDKANVSYYKIRSGKLNDPELSDILKAVDVLSNNVICIDDSGGLTVDELCQKMKLMKRRNKIEIAVIDHLSYLSGGKKENRNQELEYILKRLRSSGKELNIPIILLSQLSREVEKRSDKTPLLSDLRDSGAIEQDADIILMLYRDDYYYPPGDKLNNPAKNNILDVFVRKNRDGMTGHIELLFERNKMRFTDLVSHEEQMNIQ